MNRLLTDSPIESDALQNLRMSYHLYQHGVISNDEPTALNPAQSNYREPIPIFVNAVFMKLHPQINIDDSFESFQNGVNTKRVKQVNLFWILLLFIGLGLISYLLSRSLWVPFAVLFLIYMYFIRFGNHFDILATELHAAVLIILSSLFLLLSIQKKFFLWYIFTGISFGLLILTKAVFFYLFILLIPFIYYFENKNRPFVKILALTGGTLLIILPWMLRNYSIYESFEITQRAGPVLHLRATQNQISGEELKGAIYYWGPQLYRDLVRNTSFGANETDFEEGGKFQRLNKGDVFPKDSLAVANGRPDQAIKYHSINRAEINRIQNELGDEDSEGSRREAYQIMKEQSIHMILNNPIRHTLMSFAFLWRGIWCFPNSTIPVIPHQLQTYIHNIVNILAYLSVYIMFMIGLTRKKPEWIAVTIIPLSMLLIHAFITQNINRFSDPVIPSMILSFVILIHPIMGKCINTLKKSFSLNEKKQ